MPRYNCIDRDAFHERAAILEEAAIADGTLETMGYSWCSQQAAAEISRLPFSVVATAMANGDPKPAKALCRGELAKNGKAMAMDLWTAIKEAVDEAHALDVKR